MREIKWTGPTVSTRYGLMIKGRVIKIPKKDADSYIAQKLAKDYIEKVNKTTEENS
jgi:hypothetical protein